jgi:hypothetical protein
VVTVPDEPAPVEPDVPEPALVPAVPPVDGVVAVEPLDAPMPELAPELVEPLALGEDGFTEPLAVPAADPMPEADPEAEPDAVGVPQAARPAAQARARMVVLIMMTPLRVSSKRDHALSKDVIHQESRMPRPADCVTVGIGAHSCPPLPHGRVGFIR